MTCSSMPAARCQAAVAAGPIRSNCSAVGIGGFRRDLSERRGCRTHSANSVTIPRTSRFLTRTSQGIECPVVGVGWGIAPVSLSVTGGYPMHPNDGPGAKGSSGRLLLGRACISPVPTRHSIGAPPLAVSRVAPGQSVSWLGLAWQGAVWLGEVWTRISAPYCDRRPRLAGRSNTLRHQTLARYVGRSPVGGSIRPTRRSSRSQSARTSSAAATICPSQAGAWDASEGSGAAQRQARPG